MEAIRQVVKQYRCHLGITKQIGPFTEAETGGDYDTDLLIEFAGQIV